MGNTKQVKKKVQYNIVRNATEHLTVSITKSLNGYIINEHGGGMSAFNNLRDVFNDLLFKFEGLHPTKSTIRNGSVLIFRHGRVNLTIKKDREYVDVPRKSRTRKQVVEDEIAYLDLIAKEKASVA